MLSQLRKPGPQRKPYLERKLSFELLESSIVLADIEDPPKYIYVPEPLVYGDFSDSYPMSANSRLNESSKIEQD